MSFPLDDTTRMGFITGIRNQIEAREIAARAEHLGYDSLWTGDHIAFTLPILDPLLQLAQFAAASSRLMLGTGVFLLPLRHPVLAAKQVVSIDQLSNGRFIFGVGVGGEFELEYDAVNVPLAERGARLEAALPLMRGLLAGEPTRGDERFYPFPEVTLKPATLQTPMPIWCGGRAPAALDRMGRLADGWLSYVVTPEQYAEGLSKIEAGALRVGREVSSFGTGHLLFARVADDYETAFESANAHLSRRYAMDFSRATKRYAAIGTPEDVAARMDEYRRAGVRHFILDTISDAQDERNEQLERFAKEVRPLLS
jgi:alkanesulfonate monooxygenase SsuD/methylene tetrahydromethanopterin reductase-like flavin-dependent oxidoreductase (luciferase family)